MNNFLPILLFSSVGLAQLQISNLTQNTSIVGLFEKYELQFDLSNTSYVNPFDPQQIDVSGIFYSPAGDSISTWGFWNGLHWIIRFSPVVTGTWQYRVVAKESNESATTELNSFTVSKSGNPGFLRISDINPHYLEYWNGDWYYGNGLANPWFILEMTPTLFDDMEEHRMNSLVYWMPSWENMLVNVDTDYDHYDMGRALNMDGIVEAAEEHDVSLILTIWNHDELRGSGHPWNVRQYYDAFNPFRNIAFPADSFFTNNTSWRYQKNLYRYIIARWGYSTGVGIWAVVSELDGCGSSSYNRSNPNEGRNIWFQQITDYFKENDPYQRPTTGSLAASPGDQNADSFWSIGYEITDIPQIHYYRYSDPNYYDNPAVLNCWGMAGIHQQMWDGWNKPTFFGEFGPKEEFDLQPEYQHYAIWTCLMNGAALSPMDWNDPDLWGRFSAEMFDDMLYLRNFLDGVDLRDSLITFTSPSFTEQLKAWGLIKPDFGMMWIWDKGVNTTVSPGDMTLSFQGVQVQPGNYIGYWYNTHEGVYVDTIIFSLTGTELSKTFSFPTFTGDIAFKYQRRIEIYPGDTDNNGTVDALDVLPIGIYFLKSGPPRDQISFEWAAFESSPWNNIPATFADANGDGIVDGNDIIGIGVNWGNNHSIGINTYLVDLQDEDLLQQHRASFQQIFYSLTNNSKAEKAMKTLLGSILDINIPAAFTLHQNFPNPFNPHTTIRFELPEVQIVTLTLYNLSGRQMDKIVDKQHFAAGTHQIRINSSHLSSGIYFYRISVASDRQTENRTAVRKMVVLK